MNQELYKRLFEAFKGNQKAIEQCYILIFKVVPQLNERTGIQPAHTHEIYGHVPVAADIEPVDLKAKPGAMGFANGYEYTLRPQPYEWPILLSSPTMIIPLMANDGRAIGTRLQSS